MCSALLMSQLGQKATSGPGNATSVVPPGPDIADRAGHVGFVPIPEVAPPFDQRAGVRPGLGVKLGSGRQGQVEFAMRWLVKAQPENTQDFTCLLYTSPSPRD